MPSTLPPSLRPGARVALVAPSGPLRDEGDLELAIANVRLLGWEPVVGAHVLARAGYLAGTDAERSADLNWALNAPALDAVWFVRGGYGATRLLRSLELDAFRDSPRVLLGFSDITALHSAVGGATGVVTYHGPTARGALTEFSARSLLAAVATRDDPCGTVPGDVTVIRSGAAEGKVLGGNLALLASLVGTPYARSFEGSILVLEDINEAMYRVDRLLQQLLLSGALRGCAAIAFGACTACAAEGDDPARGLEDVLRELAEELGVPCVSGIPVGHIADQWTVPLGAWGRLEARGAGAPVKLTITYNGVLDG